MIDTATTTKCPRRVAEIVEREIEDDIVLYDPRSDATHILNTTAAAVWWLCDGDLSPAEITDEVARFFEQDQENVTPDVARVLDEFRAQRLITYR